MAEPVPSLADRLAEVGQRSFAGREAQTRAVRFALEAADPPFVVLWLHGPPGIGKTALLRRLTTVAETAGTTSIQLSGMWAPLFGTLRYRPVPEATVTVGTTTVPFLRDWRTELDRAAGVSGAETPVAAIRAMRVLSAEEFGSAVKKALKHYRSPVELARNPLLRSRALASPDATALRQVLDEAVCAAGDRSRQVLAAIYLDATLTQERTGLACRSAPTGGT